MKHELYLHCQRAEGSRPTVFPTSFYLIYPLSHARADYFLQPNCDRIIDYRINADPASKKEFVFDSEIASLIHQLWQDPVIPKVMDHSSEFYLMDSAS